MIKEALELRVEGGRGNHCWCICLVSNGYGGLEGQGWRWWMVCMRYKDWGLVACRAMPNAR